MNFQHFPRGMRIFAKTPRRRAVTLPTIHFQLEDCRQHQNLFLDYRQLVRHV